MTGAKTDALLNNYLAAAYFAQKKNDEAVKALLAARQIDPAYLTPAFNLASYYGSQSQYDNALAQYDSVLSVDSTNISALLGKVAVYNLQGQQNNIPAVYTTIEQTGQEQGYYIYARYLLENRKVDDAITSVEKGLKNFPESVSLLELQGGLALSKNEPDKAQLTFEKLAQLDPEKGYSSLVRLFLQKNEPQQAEKLINDLLQQNGDKDYPYLLSSGLLISQQNLNKAQEVVKQGQQRVADTLRLDMQLARILDADGNRSQAAQLYQRILEKSTAFCSCSCCPWIS